LDRLYAFPGQSSCDRRTGVAPVSNFLDLNQRQARRLSYN
jgi:hypothetical protein